MDYTAVGNMFPYSKSLCESSVTKLNDTSPLQLSSSTPCANTVQSWHLNSTITDINHAYDSGCCGSSAKESLKSKVHDSLL